jgi:hypothetical protein
MLTTSRVRRYDKEGQKLIRKGRKRDKLDALLARNDSAKDWRTIYDEYNDEEITLSKEELQLIQRIRQGRFPDVEVNPFCVLLFLITNPCSFLYSVSVFLSLILFSLSNPFWFHINGSFLN